MFENFDPAMASIVILLVIAAGASWWFAARPQSKPSDSERRNKTEPKNPGRTFLR